MSIFLRYNSGLEDSPQHAALLGGAGIDVLAWNKRLMKGGGEGGWQCASNRIGTEQSRIIRPTDPTAFHDPTTDHAGKKKGKGKAKGRSPASSIRPFLQDHGFLFARPSSQAFLRLCDGLVA